MGADYLEAFAYMRKDSRLDTGPQVDQLELYVFLYQHPELCATTIMLENSGSDRLWYALEDHCEHLDHTLTDEQATGEEPLPLDVAVSFYEHLYNTYRTASVLANREAWVQEVDDGWFLIRTPRMSWSGWSTELYEILIGLRELPNLIKEWWGVSDTPPPKVFDIRAAAEDVTAIPDPAGGTTTLTTTVEKYVGDTLMKVEVSVAVRVAADGSIVVVDLPAHAT
jgi:hypothetical protein